MNSVLTAPSRPPAPAAVPPSTAPPRRDLPPRIDSGMWRAGHVQGIAVDQDQGFVYFSFTTLLVKTDLSGTVIGSVTGFTGHLGDVAFNPHDGRVYASLEYKAAASFYVAVFDVDRVTRRGMDAESDGVVTAVYLKEVTDDFTAGVRTEDGRHLAHRYGCSGIDGISFGPTPGDPYGPWHLMVAYGIYSDTSRNDNDHQVLLQYDPAGLRPYERTLRQDRPHRNGPDRPQDKFFVRTGNTRFGVQNLKYDPHTGHWFLGVYQGAKDAFPNYRLFMVDGTVPPVRAPLGTDAGPEHGRMLQLHPSGLHDSASGVSGWDFRADVGFEALGDGYYYVSEQRTGPAGNGSLLRLHRWTGNAPAPFAPAPLDLLDRTARPAPVRPPGPVPAWRPVRSPEQVRSVVPDDGRLRPAAAAPQHSAG